MNRDVHIVIMMTRIIVLIILSQLLAGCFLFRDEDEVQPAELVDFTPEVEMRRVWRMNVGNGQGDKYNRLIPSIVGANIYTASNNGNVVAVNRNNGNRVWRYRVEADITGGVGVGNGLVLVGTGSPSIIALSQETGDFLWEAGVPSEVLSVPKIANNVVVVQSVDGKLTGLDASNGEQLWIYESTVPALSLRGTSSPLILENFVIAAFANGTVVSIALDNGTLRWEERVAIPTGRSEIDRMIDIDGELFVNEQGLLVVPSYQGYLAAMDVITGQLRWRVQESSVQGGASGFGNIYICDQRGNVKAYRTGQDTPVWNNEQLSLRQLSPPVSFNNYVAVGDYEGYVHLLSQVDGRFMGRFRVDGDGVRAPMLVRDNTLYIYGNSGSLSAHQIR